MTEAVAVTPRWPRREAREYQGELALRLARMRNAGCWPFQICDCHIANH